MKDFRKNLAVYVVMLGTFAGIMELTNYTNQQHLSRIKVEELSGRYCSEDSVEETETDICVMDEVSAVSADITSSDCTFQLALGQYNCCVDPEEYTYLAEVIEHEGGGCSVEVKERIGIVLLNRVFNPNFQNSILECKEAPGQYFSGRWEYTQESEEIAKNLISIYNSGGDYWAKYCQSHGLTWDTCYQRNDYAVPGTTFVYQDVGATSGGYKFTMVYSK